MREENIAAIATPLGIGGISIIRVSGKSAIARVNEYLKFDITSSAPNSINYNKFIDKNGVVIDECLVSIFKAPRSFTGEDVVEINSHGGLYITQKILEILTSDPWISLAQPGEFSKTAFLNGKKNLLEVEAIMNKISASNDMAFSLSSEAELNFAKAELRRIYEQLLAINAAVEVKLDYPEYQDIAEVMGDDLVTQIQTITEEIKAILSHSQQGEAFISGVNTVIVGEPNAGKSSLLNYLAKTDRAIVSDIAGTTRDIVQSQINLSKITLNLIDTAGIRESDDAIEQIGVQKSLAAIKDADLVIWIIDKNKGQLNEEIKTQIGQKKHLILFNKCDDKIEVQSPLPNVLSISIKEKFNLDLLEDKILTTLGLENYSSSTLAYVSGQVNQNSLRQVISCLTTALENIALGLEIDIVQIDLKQAMYHLGEILGVNVKNDLLDQLFSNYCLGK